MINIIDKVKEYVNREEFWTEKEVKSKPQGSYDDEDTPEENQRRPIIEDKSYKPPFTTRSRENTNNTPYGTSSSDGDYNHIKRENPRTGNAYPENGGRGVSPDPYDEILRGTAGQNRQTGSGRIPGIAVKSPVSIKDDIESLLVEIQADKIVFFGLDKCASEFEKQKIKIFTAGVVFDRNGTFAEIRKDFYLVIPRNIEVNDEIKEIIRQTCIIPD